MINGKSGKIEYLDSLGYYQTSGPVVTDITDDGIGEFLLSIDYQIVNNLSNIKVSTTLYAIDFTQNEALPTIEGFPGHKVSSKPWIGDMDNDGRLVIAFCHGVNSLKTYTFDGLRINRLKTKIPINGKIKWGTIWEVIMMGYLKNKLLVRFFENRISLRIHISTPNNRLLHFYT